MTRTGREAKAKAKADDMDDDASTINSLPAPPAEPSDVTAISSCAECRTGYARQQSERQHAEAQLEGILHLLGMAFESTSDAILILSPDDRFVRFNGRFAALFRIPDDVLAFWSHDQVQDIMLAQIRDQTDFRSKLAKLGREPDNDFLDTFECIDGRIIGWRAAPQSCAWGGVKRVVIFQDVTERFRSDAALRREHETQAELIRKLDSTNSPLRLAEKMASLCRLSAGLAHEINNPIAFVQSNLNTLHAYIGDLLELIATYEESEAHLEADSALLARIGAMKHRVDFAYLRQDAGVLVEESRDGIRRVSEIVQNLRDFTQDIATTWQMADLHQCLDCTLKILAYQISGGVDVVRQYGDLPEIYCQPSQLNQVFMDVLLNALEAIDNRGAITIRTGTANTEVWVDIADNGHGIAPEHLPRIFDPFFSTKPAGQGLGLGLSQAYGVVSAHRGRIDVRSEVGMGSCFHIALPIVRP
ncbi:MAG TPA: ATP-binding protein [Azonexus sp.]|nr:ATP-binding protein [Azonexus sp.]